MAETTKKALIDPRVVRALSHPLRAELLDMLTERTSSPNRLKDLVGQGLSHVSYHVRELETFGAVELVDQGKVRGATEHFYRAVPNAFLGSPVWRRVPKTLRRTVAGSSLQSFIDRALKALDQGRLDTDSGTFTWLPIAVDERGQAEVAEACRATTDQLLAIHRKSQRRLARSKGRPVHYLAGVMGFEAAST